MREKHKSPRQILLYVLLGIFLFLGLFYWLAYDAIVEAGLRIWYIPIAVLLLLLTALYGVRSLSLMKKGKRNLVLTFIYYIRRYSFLIEQLVMRDFKVKYKRSILGVFWSFLNPLLMMMVQYVVFSQLFDLRGLGVKHYPIYLLCGIVIFNGFNDCSNQALRAITSNASLITKVYVPKYIYPVSKVLSSGINVVFSMVPLLLVTVGYGLFNQLYLTKAILLLPVGLFFLFLFTLGMGFLLSSLMVFFRDIEFLWGVIATMWMYATPIIYSLSMFKNRGTWIPHLMQFNPMYHYVTFIRSIVIEGKSPSIESYLICFGFGLLMLLVGGFVFKKTQDKFVLHI